MIELPHLLRRPVFGSSEWLVCSEAYGGYVTDVARRRVSPRDGRTSEQLTFGGMTGGDRMLRHEYEPTYARYLRPKPIKPCVPNGPVTPNTCLRTFDENFAFWVGFASW